MPSIFYGLAVEEELIIDAGQALLAYLFFMNLSKNIYIGKNISCINTKNIVIGKVRSETEKADFLFGGVNMILICQWKFAPTSARSDWMKNSRLLLS